MAGRALLVMALLGVLSAYIFFNDASWGERETLRRSVDASYVLPSKFSRILALDHKGLLADYQLLKTITFYGERVMYGQELNDDDWHYIISGLETVTDLDPYFLDPYILAESLLTWGGGKIEQANRLLEKGRSARRDDWQLPFFIGFNHFYFLGDNQKGAEFLMAASRLPGSPSFLPGLAARLSYYGGQAKLAVVFLKGILLQTKDERIRNRLKMRLLALEGAAFLEDRVGAFVKEQGRSPQGVDELVSKGYVKELPEEPYGGTWVLLKTGRVFSTSKFVPGEE